MIPTLLSLVSLSVLVVGAGIGVVREALVSAARAGVAALLFGSQIAIVAFLVHVLRLKGGAYPTWVHVLVCAMSVLCVVATLSLMREVEGIGRKRIDEARVRALEEQMDALREYGRQLEREQERARAVRDRIAATLHEAERLLEQDDSGAAVERAAAAADLARGEHAWKTGALVIDALLARKEAACEDAGVGFSAQVDLRGANAAVETPVLVALFANAIDNAVASARIAPPDRRSVDARSRIEAGMLLIEVRNGCSDDAKVPPFLASDHAGRKLAVVAERGESIIPEHGWGLSIMRDLARRADGSFSMEIADGSCRVAVGIPVARAMQGRL